MDYDYDLSIVIPAYKEEERIHLVLDAIEKLVHDFDIRLETIVSVDASPDRTADVARGYSDRIPGLVVHEGRVNKGKGGAVKKGIELAHGQYILFADADNSTPIEQVQKLMPFAHKYEVVIGSRYCDGGKLAIPQSFVRRAGSRVLNFIIQTIAIYGIKDTQCGFKLFEAKAAKKIFARTTLTNFSFDIELLAIARKLGYKIKEVGIIWYDNPHSTVNPIKDGAQMIKDSWSIHQNLRKSKYN